MDLQSTMLRLDFGIIASSQNRLWGPMYLEYQRRVGKYGTRPVARVVSGLVWYICAKSSKKCFTKGNGGLNHVCFLRSRCE